MKGNKLHYAAIESRNNVILLEPDNATPKESYSYLILENLILPKGSLGVYVGQSNNNYRIDFGEGNPKSPTLSQ